MGERKLWNVIGISQKTSLGQVKVARLDFFFWGGGVTPKFEH